jgi:hypothetical protein
MLLAVAIVVVALACCGTATGAVTTYGEGLGGGWNSFHCEAAGCAFVNGIFGPVGHSTNWPVAPSTGLIVGLNVIDATTPGTMRVRPVGEGPAAEFIFAPASPPIAIVPSEGIQHYPVSLPVASDQRIGLSISKGASIGYGIGPYGYFSRWEPEPQEGAVTPFPNQIEGAVGFNFEVLPPAKIRSLTPSSGPTTGATVVSIVGGNFTGATAVSFGDVAAKSFSVENDGLIVATAPPHDGAAVPITITTPAGTVTQGSFIYSPPSEERCVVPRLRARTLKSARRALGGAGCELGKVRKLDGATAKTGRVSRQGVPAGTKRRFGASVSVTLKPPRGR